MEYGLELGKYNLNMDTVCLSENVLKRDKCDKYDYLISACSGIISGLIDVFFVASPLNSSLGKVTDGQMDKMVITFAKKMGWNPQKSENITSAIRFLEKSYKVNYDQAHSQAVGGAFNMAAKNHHMKSLGHSPSLVGLFFSILDQFNGTSHFVDNGKLISIKVEEQKFSINGQNFHSKIFCGFVNWLGHIMSDIVGSSGARAKGNRGSGLVIPFTELFQFCNFGSLKNKQEKLNFANAMVKVFENGYDFRFGMSMALPVILNELFIRAFWVIKRRYYKHVEWKDCIISSKHDDLRIMLLISNTTLCIVDGLDALIRSKGNVIAFILRFNIIAWSRLVILVFKELKVRYGQIAIELLKDFIKDIQYWSEAESIREFYERISAFDDSLEMELLIFIEEVDRETKYINSTVEFMRDINNSDEEKNKKTIELAQHCKVDDDKILKNISDLDDFFLK